MIRLTKALPSGPRQCPDEPALAAAAQKISALTLLIILSPLLAMAALAVYLGDGRPIIYRHRRIGKHGQPFDVLKFRSMTAAGHGPSLTAGGDPRITAVGKFLRKRKLDELPQFWNVVRGTMAFIGPRPEAPEFVNAEDPLWQAVLAVTPGITDFASLVYHQEEELLRGAANPDSYYRNHILPHKLDLNMLYLERRSWQCDLRLLLSTALLSFFPHRVDERQLRRFILS